MFLLQKHSPFVANEYVSACYNIKCKTDNRDTWPGTMFKQVVMDTNGVYDAGSDEIFYQRGGFFCCGQYRTVKVNGPVPEEHNAFLIDVDGNVVPVLLAYGKTPDNGFRCQA